MRRTLAAQFDDIYWSVSHETSTQYLARVTAHHIAKVEIVDRQRVVSGQPERHGEGRDRWGGPDGGNGRPLHLQCHGELVHTRHDNLSAQHVQVGGDYVTADVF